MLNLPDIFSIRYCKEHGGEETEMKKWERNWETEEMRSVEAEWIQALRCFRLVAQLETNMEAYSCDLSSDSLS